MFFLPSLACWNVKGLLVGDHLNDCCKIINYSHVDFFYLLETKLSLDPSCSSLHHLRLQLFPLEASVNNFDRAKGGHILLKWKSDLISFSLFSKGGQFIHGKLSYGSSSIFLTCIYACNEAHEHIHFWNALRDMSFSISSPWLVMG